jgi:menaquinone-dependent protoporphyrinogen oxidase
MTANFSSATPNNPLFGSSFQVMSREFDRRNFLQLAAGLLAIRPALAAPRPVLVAYASRCGSTQEIANAIVQDLKARGCAAELRRVQDVKTLTGYRAVVLGSAVRFGKWLPEASDFVRAHQPALKALPTAFFSVHLMNSGNDEASRKARLGYTEPVRALVRPGLEAFFTGKMDSGRLTFAERMLMKFMKGHNEDRRDWTAIHAWARQLLPALA